MARKLVRGAREARCGRFRDALSTPQVQRGIARVHLPRPGQLGTEEFADLSRSGGEYGF